MRRLSVSLLALALLAPLGCDGARPLDEIPESLHGIWRTDGSRYEKRFVELRYREVILGAGKVGFDRLAIQRIEVEQEEGASVYRLHYIADEGYPDQLEVSFQESPDPTLRIGNIPFPWHRTDAR